MVEYDDQDYPVKGRLAFEPVRAPLLGLVLFWLFVAILAITYVAIQPKLPAPIVKPSVYEYTTQSGIKVTPQRRAHNQQSKGK